eukprot:gene37677-45771_t
MSAKFKGDGEWSQEPEKLLDRMLRRRRYFNSVVPLKLRRRITSSLRTAWTVFITLFIMQYWEWSPIIQFLSASIAIISSSMYFGLWLEKFYFVSYGITIGSALGVLIGFAYKITPLHIVLIFLSLTWINRMPKWDRLTHVLSSLSMMLTAIWPYVTDGKVKGLPSLAFVLSIMFIPYIITGFSLLFPRLALATYHARFQALLVCRKL